MSRPPQLFDYIDGPFPRPAMLGDRHYVPVLKSRMGEMMALRQVAAADWTRMTPLIEVEVSDDEGAEPRRQGVLARLPEILSRSLGSRPLFVDLGRLTTRQEMLIGSDRAPTRVGVVDYLIDSCESRRLNWVPIVRSGIDAATLRNVIGVTGNDRGACLRVAKGAMHRGRLGG
jgi:hypothetical protein